MRFPKTVNHRTGERKCCIDYRSDPESMQSLASERSIARRERHSRKGKSPRKGDRDTFIAAITFIRGRRVDANSTCGFVSIGLPVSDLLR